MKVNRKNDRVFINQNDIKFLLKENKTKYKTTQSQNASDCLSMRVMSSETQCFLILFLRMKAQTFYWRRKT